MLEFLKIYRTWANDFPRAWLFSRSFVYFALSAKLVVVSSFAVAISLYFYALVVLSVS